MKFLHCADIHIGGSSYLPDNIERTTTIIQEIFKVATDKKVATVVIAGDIFDDSNTTALQRNIVEQLFLGYDAAGFSILAIPGNHDTVNKDGETTLRYLDILYRSGKFKNSTIVETTTYRQIGDTVFILLVHKQHKFKEECEAAIKNLQSSLVMDYKHVVLVAHEMIMGSVLDNNMVSPRGASLPEGQITYVALGDIHGVQKVSPRVYYSGAPYQIKFGDSTKKGVLIVDTENPDNPEFVPIKSKEMIVVSSKEDIRDDCYVKLSANKIDLNGDLPENVVKVAYVKDDIELSVTVDENKDLKDNVSVAVKQQLQEDLLELSMQEIEEIFQGI